MSTTNNNVFNIYSVAIVTPFTDPAQSENGIEQQIDVDALKSVIENVAAGSKRAARELGQNDSDDKDPLIGGIIVAGTTGEQHCMTIEERVDLYKLAVEFGKSNGIRVACGVAAPYTDGAVRLAKAAVSAGCDGIMLGLPPYIRPSEEEIVGYVRAVKRALPADMPLLLYNNGVRNATGSTLTPQTVVTLHQEGTIFGVKLAVAPHEVFLADAAAILALDPSVRLYTGSDANSANLLLGCAADGAPWPRFHGLTSIAGNVYPYEMALTTAQLAGARQGRNDDARMKVGRSMHGALAPVIDSVLLNCSSPVGVKYAMRCRTAASADGAATETGTGAARVARSSCGNGGFSRLPLGLLSEAKCAEIRSALATYGL